MEEYEIRIKQLRKIKMISFLKISSFILIGLIVEFGLYYGIVFLQNMISFTLSDLFYIIYFSLFNTIIIIISVFIFVRLNIEYRKQFKDYLFSECKLEEIYFLDHKLNTTEEKIKYLKKIFFINKLKILSSFSDASTHYSLDIENVRYNQNGHGIIFSIHYVEEKNRFLQICKSNFDATEYYHDTEIKRYCLRLTSLLKDYYIYSNLASETYLIENNEYGSKIIRLEKYFKSPINLILDNGELSIFVENYQIRIADGLLKSLNAQRFFEKIESLKELHNILFEIVSSFDCLFNI